MGQGPESRKTRHRLGIDEIDSIWIWTFDNTMFRWKDGCWEHSQNVFYGNDMGWTKWLVGEPATPPTGDYVFIEIPSDQLVTDPEFAQIILEYKKQ